MEATCQGDGAISDDAATAHSSGGTTSGPTACAATVSASATADDCSAATTTDDASATTTGDASATTRDAYGDVPSNGGASDCIFSPDLEYSSSAMDLE